MLVQNDSQRLSLVRLWAALTTPCVLCQRRFAEMSSQIYFKKKKEILQLFLKIILISEHGQSNATL